MIQKETLHLKTRKIKLNPTSTQRKILNEWFDTARWTYNKCVESIKNRKCFKTKKSLRSKHLNSEIILKNKNNWVFNTPYDVRDEAMNDLLKAVTYQDSTGKPYDLKFRKKRDQSQSIVILKKHYKKKGVFFPKFLGKEPIRGFESLPEKLDYDTRLQRTRLGDFYLCVLSPIEIKDKAPKQIVNKGVISLDPGVRTFMTGYDPVGKTYEWGKGDMSRITRLAISSDKLISIINTNTSRKNKDNKETKMKHRERYSLQKAYLRINQKIRRLVNDLHEKLSRWLVDNYRVIVLPEFNVSSMIKKGDRKIRNKTARSMVTWSHYKFRQKLISKSRETPWCKIIHSTEEFTSQTCGCCGFRDENLGSNKTFKCRVCKTVIDRDCNGARNILLLLLTKLNPKRGGYLESRVKGINPLYVVA